MDQPLRAQILILAQQPATAQRWAAMLRGPESRIWLAHDDVPDTARLDLILTDRSPDTEAPHASAPAANALSPAPVTMMTLISRSASSCLMIRFSPRASVLVVYAPGWATTY